MDCIYVDVPSRLTTGALVGSGIIVSVIAKEPLADRSICVELPTKSLKELANTLLAEVTTSIVWDALSAADKNELAIRSPEIVGN